jgi:hypothetical protein
MLRHFHAYYRSVYGLAGTGGLVTSRGGANERSTTNITHFIA